MTDELILWLTQQLDDDERIAAAAHRDLDEHGAWSPDQASSYHDVDGMCRTEFDHIARFDPARVLREVEAKRALLNDCVHTLEVEDYGYTLADKTIRRLASIYSDRPGYKQEWRIES